MNRKALPAPPRVDYLTKSGAIVLAEFIENFWKARGYPNITAQPFLVDGAKDTYGVRSNVGPDGFPPGRKTLGSGAFA